jgi:hypothetical protein
VVTVAIILLVGACSDDANPTETSGPSAMSPEVVVVTLMEAIIEGRFEDTPALTDTTQAALLTLAEGADASEVAEVIGEGADAVAANFWSGFAQTLEPGLDVASFDVSVDDPVTQDGEEFVRVTLVSDVNPPQYFVVRRDDGFRVDLMATFGPVLAQRLVPPVESLLSSANADASTVLALLAEAAPSLRFSGTRPDLPADAHQSLLALIERVTRTG